MSTPTTALPRPTGPVRDYGRVLLGLVIITFGVLYLLDTADTLDAGSAIDDWWPVLIVAIGVFQLGERSRPIAGPLVVIGIGVALLLVTTDALGENAWGYAWPMVLIVIGVAILTRWAGAGPVPRGPGRDDAVVASGIFGGPKIANASRSFRGASLTGIFGGVTLDLRDARPAPEGAAITATAVFGGIDILVPHGWRISMRGTPIFGGVEDKTEHAEPPAADAPELSIDALALFGGVEIKHEK